MPIEINYTVSEIARVLKYTECGGTITKRIQNSIRKLANCTITSIYEGGLYDVENKNYIKSEKGFHIIETYEMYRYSECNEKEKRLKANEIKSYNKVTINKFFYDSMCSGYCKIIPFEQLVGLKYDVSQRLFSLLEGWYCDKKPFVYFNYETLYSRIPLNPVAEGETPMPTKEKNRLIKKGAEELLKTDYIKGYIVVPRQGIYFIFDGELKDVDINTIRTCYYGLEKYGDLKDVVSTLLRHGIDENDIDRYISSNNIEYVKALLRYYDMMLRYDNIKGDGIGFLIKGLKEKYNIDEKYYSKKINNVI
jgi:hypothetical protein